jgi:hypothetical protein
VRAQRLYSVGAAFTAFTLYAAPLYFILTHVPKMAAAVKHKSFATAIAILIKKVSTF